MSKLNTTLLMTGLAFAGLVSGYLFNQWTQQQKLEQVTAKTTSGKISDIRPAFTLPDLEGKMHSVSEWDGKVLLINFWATWCPPCRKEIPAFIELQDRYRDKGFVVIGIALDQKQAVIDFTDPMGVNYPILMGEDGAIELAKAYGNSLGVLPYTVIVDRKGKIIHRKRTGLNYQQVETMIKPLL